MMFPVQHVNGPNTENMEKVHIQSLEKVLILLSL